MIKAAALCLMAAALSVIAVLVYGVAQVDGLTQLLVVPLVFTGGFVLFAGLHFAKSLGEKEPPNA